MQRLTDVFAGRGRAITLTAMVCLFVVSVAMFQSTLAVYISLDKVTTGETTVTDVSLNEDTERVAVTVRFENPTGTEVDIIATQLHTRVNGTLVTQLAGGSTESITVGPHETATVTVQLPLRDDMLGTAEQGIESTAASVVVSGELKLTIRGEQTAVRIDWER